MEVQESSNEGKGVRRNQLEGMTHGVGAWKTGGELSGNKGERNKTRLWWGSIIDLLARLKIWMMAS